MQGDFANSTLLSHRVLALPELLDTIFSHLHLSPKWDKDTDRGDLRSCTLVNHMWAEMSHPHLWSALSSRVASPGTVDSRGHSLARSLEDLHAFLASSAAIRNAVRTLTIVGMHGNYSTSHLSAATLFTILDSLPALQHLLLDHICHILVSAPQVQYQRLLSVQSIELRGCRRELKEYAAEDFLVLAEMFKEVGELIVGDFFLCPYGKIRPTSPETRISRIDFTLSHDIAELLIVMKIFDMRHLTSLTIASMDFPELRTRVEDAFREVGPHLTEIGIRLNDDDYPAQPVDTQIYSHMILSTCHRLRCVRFIFAQWRHNSNVAYPEHRVGWKRLIACLTHLPDTVHTVLIDFSCGTAPAYGAGTSFGDLVLAEGLPFVGDLRSAFEEAITKRRQPTRVDLRPGGRPVFSLREQTALRALFPRLSTADILDF